MYVVAWIQALVDIICLLLQDYIEICELYTAMKSYLAYEKFILGLESMIHDKSIGS